MRHMHNTLRRSITIQQAFQTAKNYPTTTHSTPAQPEPVAEAPVESVVEPQPEPVVEVKPIVEEVKPVEQPKVEQPKTTTTTTQTTRLPKI